MTIRQLPPPSPKWAITGSHDWSWEDTRLRDLRRRAAARRKLAQRDGAEIERFVDLMQAQQLIGLAGALRPIYELRDIPSSPAVYWHVELAERALDMLISRFGPDASAVDVWNMLIQSESQDRSASDSANDSNAGAAGDTSDPAQDAERADDDVSDGGASGELSLGGAPESWDAAQQQAEQEDDRGADEVTASGMDSGADPAPGDGSDHRDDTADASASLVAGNQSDDQTEAQQADEEDNDQSDDRSEADGETDESDEAGEAGEEIEEYYEEDEEAGEEASEDAGEDFGEVYYASQTGGRVAKVSPSFARIAEVARIARALSRLMADTSRPEPSPLWDGKRVVRELVSHQVRLHRMRRDVPGIKGLLVLYDVSGSCEWIAARTWGIAEALATRYSSLYAAQTPATEDYAEGSLDPASIIGRSATRFAKLPHIIGDGYGNDIAGWMRLKAAGVSHMLVFGDAHGTAGYLAAAAAGIRVLWANPNAEIAPRNTSWCDYTIIADGDIAAAVETLVRRQ
jgi:hypothetical protein